MGQVSRLASTHANLCTKLGEMATGAIATSRVQRCVQASDVRRVIGPWQWYELVLSKFVVGSCIDEDGSLPEHSRLQQARGFIGSTCCRHIVAAQRYPHLQCT